MTTTAADTNTTYFDAQPRSTSELITQTFQIFGKHFAHFAGLSLLVLGPIALLSLLGGVFSNQLTLSMQENITGNTSIVRSFAQTSSNLIAFCTTALILIVAIFVPWMEGALTYSLFERVLGRAPSVREAYKAAQPRFASLWGSNFIARLVLFAPLLLLSCLGSCFIFFIGAATAGDTSADASNLGLTLGLGAICLVPLLTAYIVFLLVVGVNWRFRAPAIVAEGVDATRALGRSTELAKGMRVSLLGRMLVFWVAEAILVIGPNLASTGLSFASSQITEGSGLAFAGSILFLLIGLVAQLVVTPLHLIYVALLYLDVRVRKENLFVPPVRSAVIEPVLMAPAPPQPMTPALPLPPVTPVYTPSTQNIPTAPIGALATPAQKIGALFNQMRMEGPNAELLNDLGMAYMEVGDLGGALDALTRARELAPNDADIAYNLVLLHRARKDTASARSMMQEYLKLETNPADVERVRNDVRFSDLI